MLFDPTGVLGQELHVSAHDIHVKVDRPDKYVALIKAENQRMVVKASLIPDSLYDRRGIDHLQPTGLPLPIVVKEVHGSPHILVLTWIRGEKMTMMSPHDARMEAGRALRKIHSVDPSEFFEQHQWRDRLRSSLDHELEWWLMNGGTKEAVDGVHGYLGTVWGDLKHRGHHTVLGDARGEHFLVSEGHLSGIIDMGEVWVGDPIMDFAGIAVRDPLLFFSILEGYAPSPDEFSAILRFMPLYVLLRRLAAAHWCQLFADPKDAEIFLQPINLENPTDWTSRTYVGDMFSKETQAVCRRARGHWVMGAASIA